MVQHVCSHEPQPVCSANESSLTNYNLVISILSMFFLLVKAIMYIVNVFPPVLSVVVHSVLVALYTTSVYYQASSDTSDPAHPQNGPAWYITKSCSVASNPDNIGYCKQAKSAFGATVSMLGVFIIYLGLAVWSCLPSTAHRAEVAAERKERDEKYARLEAMHEEAKAAQSTEYGFESYPPETPGLQSGMNPMTPRTKAFNTLGGTKDLPLRTHFSSPSPRPTSPNYNLRSPGLPRSPMNMNFEQARIDSPPTQQQPDLERQTSPKPGEPMYFPPPPKKANKK
jgi:hypothetical protein